MELSQWLCLLALMITALAVTWKTLRVRSGILHLPFLATVGLLGFLGPQAVGVIRSGSAPWYAVCKFLLFACACLVALYLGWSAVRVSVPRPVNSGYQPLKQLRLFFWMGLLLEAVGVVGLWKLAGLVGGLRNFYLEAGGYSLEWRGAPVIYFFFADYLRPGGILIVLSALRLGSAARLVFALPAVASDLAAVILVARRTPLAGLLMVGLCLAYLTKRYMPPRWALAVVGAVAVSAIFNLPAYRRAGGLLSSAPTTAGGGSIAQAINTGGTEFRDGSYLIQVTEETGAFHYGLGFYNSFVRYFVPRRLAGDEGKEHLLIDLPDAGHVGPRASEVANRYGWEIDPATVPTGPASVFQQFWYLGWICYYFLGRWLKGYWARAVAGELWSQAVYAEALTFAVAAAVNDIYAIYLPVFKFVLPGAVAVRVAGIRARAWASGRVPAHSRPVAYGRVKASDARCV